MNELHLKYKRETGNTPIYGTLGVYGSVDPDSELEPDLIVNDFDTDANILLELRTKSSIDILDQKYIEWLEQQLLCK